MDKDKDKSERKGGSKPNSIFGSRQALITLLFGCASMPRDLLHALSLLLGAESQVLAERLSPLSLQRILVVGISTKHCLRSLAICS